MPDNRTGDWTSLGDDEELRNVDEGRKHSRLNAGQRGNWHTPNTTPAL